MAQAKTWTVTTSGDHPLDQVRKQLSDAGLSDITSLEEIGIITGSATDEVAKRLRKIPGVVDVSPGGEIGIGPPDSKTTW